MMQMARTATAVSGRTTEVLFFAGSGSLSLWTGLSAMHCLNPITIGAAAAILIALVISALRLLQASKSAATARSEEEEEIKRAFARVNTIQYIAILASVVLLNLIQRPEFIVPVLAFIVGMRLFPLATLFRYPAHTVTGTLLVVWATGVVAALQGEALTSIGAMGAAMILLGSAAYSLISANRAAKSGFTLGAITRGATPVRTLSAAG